MGFRIGSAPITKPAVINICKSLSGIRGCFLVLLILSLSLVACSRRLIIFEGTAAISKGATDRIVVGMPWEPVSFYPLRALDSASYFAGTLVYEGLVRFDERLVLVPGLAESFSVSDDGLKYRFKLRKELRYSSGESITAEDVRASVEAARAPSSPFYSDYKDIIGVDVLPNEEVVLRLSQRCQPLLSRMAEIRVLPKRLSELADKGKSLLSRAPICSGPFKLSRWESGLELVFEPNENYWGTHPKFKTLVWRVVPDRGLLALAMARGELDVAQIDGRNWRDLLSSRACSSSSTQPTNPNNLSDRDCLELDRFRGTRTVYFGFNLRKPLLSDRQVRRAICQSINRQQIVDQFYAGYGRVPQTDVSPGSWVYNPRSTNYSYDPKAAVAVLRQAGFALDEKKGFWSKNGDKLALKLLTTKDLQELAEILSTSLRAMEVPNEVEVVEYSALRLRYLQKSNFDVVVWSRSCGPDPECTLVWSSDGPLNFSKFQNKRVDELLSLGRTAPTREKRIPAYAEIQEILSRELPWVFIAQPELLVAHRKCIEGVTLAKQEETGLPWDNPFFNAAHWSVHP